MSKAFDFDTLVQCVELCRKFHEDSRFCDIKFDKDEVAQSLVRIANSPDTFFMSLKRDKEDKVVGIFIGFVTSMVFSPKLVAENLIFYIEPEHRGGTWFSHSVEAFECWAILQGAVIVDITHNSGIECGRAIPLFERKGYKTVGTILSKEL